MKRRDFLRFSGVVTGSAFLPKFLNASSSLLSTTAAGNRNLIVIQLSGGNDSLNMVVPHRNDIYYRERKNIAISKDSVLPLTDEVGLNPVMVGMKELYDSGDLSVINGVGYPEPNRSHFRSMEIWHSASDSDQNLQSGWIGRMLDAMPRGTVQPYSALELDDAMSLVMQGEQRSGLASNDPSKLDEQLSHPFIQRIAEQSTKARTHHHHSEAAYLQKALAETTMSIAYLEEKTDKSKNYVAYPMNKLGNQLRKVAGLINAGSETKVHYLSHGGFDTHANQKGTHNRLLTELSQGLAVLKNDLKQGGKWGDTLVLVFSEFGRRVKQNAGRGTDHGTAGTVFLVGGSIKAKGVAGEIPSLQDLDKGDLKYHTDFRSIYKNIVEDWFHLPSDRIILSPVKSIQLV